MISCYKPIKPRSDITGARLIVWAYRQYWYVNGLFSYRPHNAEMLRGNWLH